TPDCRLMVWPRNGCPVTTAAARSITTKVLAEPHCPDSKPFPLAGITCFTNHDVIGRGSELPCAYNCGSGSEGSSSRSSSSSSTSDLGCGSGGSSSSSSSSTCSGSHGGSSSLILFSVDFGSDCGALASQPLAQPLASNSGSEAAPNTSALRTTSRESRPSARYLLPIPSGNCCRCS